MQTILPGDWYVNKFLPKQKCKEGKWRPFRYCVQISVPEGDLWFHTLTRRLVLAQPGEEEALAEGYFLVPETFDDRRFVEQVREMTRRIKHPKRIQSYTIFTTTHCNAQCPYCFETGSRGRTMDEDTARRTAAFIARHCGGQPVTIRWFGGEPLLNMKAMDVICQELKRLGIAYTSTVVSNGLLANAAFAKAAKERWNVTTVQITLDGTEKIYNRTKRFKGQVENAYQTVLKHIELLAKNGIKVRVRLNVSETNGLDLLQLVDELAARFVGQNNISVFCQALFEKKGKVSLRREASAEREVRRIQRQLMEKTHAYGWFQMRLDPELHSFVCTADSGRVVTVLPEGRLGVCEHRLDEDFVGDVDHDSMDETVLAMYRHRIADREECVACPAYLECGRQARCDGVVAWCSEEKREVMLRDLQLRMEQEYRVWRDEHEVKV